MAAARRQKPKSKLRSFLHGFLSVLLVAAVFYSGFQFGRGNWQIRLGEKASITANKGLPQNLDYSSVDEIYRSLKQNYDGNLDVDELIAGLKKGLVEAAGDPYTTYLDKQAASEFSEQLNGSFSGIGAELGKDGNNIIIIAPIAGFPADKAGLKAKDIIIAIDGQDATGLSVDEAVSRIRGEKGTSVKLTIIRGEKRLEISIERDVITIPSVESKKLENNIGYIRITRFANDTYALTQKAASDFKAGNVKGIILDLRNNPGGYLSAAVNVSELWLKSGQTVVEEKRDGATLKAYRAQSDGIVAGLATIVLINEGSASASEITAGALKDNRAATILGVTSFGKGSVQEINTFSGGDALKVTIARWYTPNGKNIDKEGIQPDIKKQLSDEDVANETDSQLDAAMQLLLQ